MKRTGNKPLGIIVYGACGRMGRSVTQLASASDGFRITALVEKEDHPSIGSALAGLALVDRIPQSADRDEIVIAFPDMTGFTALLANLRHSRLRLVCGTTGLRAPELAALKRYARTRAVLHDSNMSIGISALKQLARSASILLGERFDAEIVENHHRHKKDAPSGTALSLAREIAADRDIVSGRGRGSGRKRGTVHLHSIRAGGIPGDHAILFASEEEVVTLSHRALSREVFARGALRAARFIASRSSGFFSMRDVLDEEHP